MFALVDCNNFYASCERLFRPDLRNKPIIVLSNNDGCAIARSNEAKKLGIGMGEPYFKIKALCQEHKVTVFSSNYTLYDNLSNRIMQVIAEFWPSIEVYSIDEAFLDLSSMDSVRHTDFCTALQKRIFKHTGIPTSIGIGETKTLAKIANHIAKRKLEVPVFNVAAMPHWLDKVAVSEVWGVGWKLAPKLAAMNIETAGDLARADASLIRKRFSVALQRTAFELRKMPCLTLDEIAPNKSIVSSRSFGAPQTQLQELNEAVSGHIARAWEKMRQQHLVASYLSVSVYSNRFRIDLAQYSNTLGFKLITPTDDLRQLTHFAKVCLQKIFKENIQYKKVGVLFDGLIPKEHQQIDLFNPVTDDETQGAETLMNTIERINKRFGQSAIKLASEGFAKPWSMRRDMKSPSYTTQWGELPIVKTEGLAVGDYKKKIC